MSTEKMQEGIVAIAKLIIPDLENNVTKETAFWNSFVLFFESLDAESKGKIKLLLKVINLICIFSFLKPLGNLKLVQMEKLIFKIENFPVKLIVGGFTGIRSLVMISYYSMPQTWPLINYSGPLLKS